MADKSVGELISAQSVTPTDLFVLEQNGTAKKLTGQTLENWLVSFADGHGGIQSISKLSTSGLVDTYRITLADTTTFDFVVNNGRSITGISKTGTSGLADTYTISYNDGTTGKFTVTNGAKGDKGDNAYVWIKYASQEPTESSHSMGDIPDDWIGIYSGNASTAPTDWKQYKWFKHKGEKGDIGIPATLVTKSVTYQVSDSGTIIPSGAWVTDIPVVTQGKYLWTKTELQFNSGDPIVSYSVARMGIDGTGSVSSVAGVSPDATGNVTLTAADVGALPSAGGSMTGAINMNGQTLSGLNAPTEDTHAATKAYADKMLPKSGGTMTGAINMNGQPISGLISPTEDTQAATKAYADKMLPKTGGTMTGAINMNGQPIFGLISPTEDTQAANKGYVDGKLSMELLWENASPDSSFSGQMVELTGSYDYYKIVYKGTGDTSGNMVSECFYGKRTILTCATVSATVYFGIRPISWSGNNMVFGDCIYTDDGITSVPNTNNLVCVPKLIYGLKGVSM